MTGISFNEVTGVIKVEGSAERDAVRVFDSANAGDVTVSFNGVGQLDFTKSLVTQVEFYGYGGDDWFKNTTDLGSTAFGHNGNDFLFGGSSSDQFQGGNGNDLIFGNGGNDGERETLLN